MERLRGPESFLLTIGEEKGKDGFRPSAPPSVPRKEEKEGKGGGGAKGKRWGTRPGAAGVVNYLFPPSGKKKKRERKNERKSWYLYFYLSEGGRGKGIRREGGRPHDSLISPFRKERGKKKEKREGEKRRG